MIEICAESATSNFAQPVSFFLQNLLRFWTEQFRNQCTSSTNSKNSDETFGPIDFNFFTVKLQQQERLLKGSNELNKVQEELKEKTNENERLKTGIQKAYSKKLINILPTLFQLRG